MHLRIMASALGLLVFGPGLQAQTPVTFNNQVVRILQQHCQNCHRPGNIGPFSLLTYNDAVSRATQIRHAVESREMPPWKPVNAHGVFDDERYLTEAEIQTISTWVREGLLEGDPADLPPPVNFPETWSAGVPDLAAEPAEPFTVVSEGEDVYRCFSVPLGSTTELNVRGYEVLPGNREIVHHVLLFTDSSGESEKLDADDPGPGYPCFGGAGFFNGLGALGGWAPGASPQMFPEGSGVQVPAGSRLVIQVHYSVEGHHEEDPIEPDLTRVGLHLSETALDPITILPVINTRFAIPPGHPNYRVNAILPIPSSVELVSIAPHMHLLGRRVVVEAWMPFFQRRQLIRIDDWEFHWQGIYTYREPIRLPAGTIVLMSAYYDNSSNNPSNPSNPPVTVRFGEETTDEMAITFLIVKGARFGSPGVDGGGSGLDLRGSDGR